MQKVAPRIGHPVQRGPAAIPTLKSEIEVRKLWYSVFDTNLPMEVKLSNLRIIEEEAARHVIIASDPAHAKTHAGGWRLPTRDATTASGYQATNGFTTLQTLPDDTIVIPIMITGLPYGAAVVDALSKHGKHPEVVLLSYSKSQDGVFSDGSKPSYKVYIPDSHAEFLLNNTERTVLLVDNFKTTGETFDVVGRFLARMGFSNIYEAYGPGLAHPQKWSGATSKIDDISIKTMKTNLSSLMNFIDKNKEIITIKGILEENLRKSNDEKLSLFKEVYRDPIKSLIIFDENLNREDKIKI